MSDPNQITFAQMQMLQSISVGHTTIGQISNVLRLSQDQVQSNLDILERMNFVRSRGFRQNYFLTTDAIDLLANRGMSPNMIHPAQNGPYRTEVRHTSNMKTGFNLVFGGILGAFVAIVTISMIASVGIWASYHLFLKQMIPAALLPIIPLDNFLVDLAISLVGTLSIFLPFRRSGTGILRRMF